MRQEEDGKKIRVLFPYPERLFFFCVVIVIVLLFLLRLCLVLTELMRLSKGGVTFEMGLLLFWLA